MQDESNSRPNVMIITGEASGDQHGAHLVRAMRLKNENLEFWGVGGKAMEKAGVRLVYDASRLSVVGIIEVAAKLPAILEGARTVKQHLQDLAPALLILVDFPDFNLHIAKTARKLKIPVFYYISPQVWAWRRGRVKTIKSRVNHLAVILPFEVDFYKQYQIPVSFVGHPLLDNLPDSANAPPTKSEPTGTGNPPVVIGLLPGSRDREIARHLPVMLEAAALLTRFHDNLKFRIPVASSVTLQSVEALIQSGPRGLDITLETEGIQTVFQQSRLLVAASGTVTLEAALYGTPMIIIYRLSQSSYWLGRKLIRVPFIGLANLIAGREIVPELIQDQATPEMIADRIMEMLHDPGQSDRMRKELLKVREALGAPGASARTADIALSMIRNPTTPTGETPLAYEV